MDDIAGEVDMDPFGHDEVGILYQAVETTVISRQPSLPVKFMHKSSIQTPVLKPKSMEFCRSWKRWAIV